MRTPLFFAIFLTATYSCFAQNQYDRDIKFKLPEGKHFYIIPPDSLWNQMPWKDSVYIFPEFGAGKIESKNGYSPTSSFSMNYNIFFESFIIRQENGNLTPFRNIDNLKYIWIDDHKFIYVKGIGYLQIIQDGRAAVAESTYMDAIVEYPTLTEYPRSLSDNRFAPDKRTRYYYREHKYFIVKTSTGRVYRVAPHVLGKIFPKEKRTIRDFAKTNKIDYNKKDDLMKIVLFCNREL